MKKCLLPLIFCLLLTACAQPQTQTRYTATFLELFDTVTTVVGWAENETAFQETASQVKQTLEIYHQLFDIYNTYDGIANLKTINDNAGIAPVTVDPILIDFLQDCQYYYTCTDGIVDVTMGSVLSLWHTARTDGINDPKNAALPDSTALAKAATHTGWDTITLDAENATVYISDPNVQFDVGAIAKGWAVQKAAATFPEGLLISVGGNVYATGAKPTDGSDWVIGVQDPDDNNRNLHTLYLSRGAVVTSGDYQRYYTVDGIRYHHIIDPKTQMPGTYWRSVTVACADSGLADALSTALFLLPLKEGRALAQKLNVAVLWIDSAGNEYTTQTLQAMLRT